MSSQTDIHELDRAAPRFQGTQAGSAQGSSHSEFLRLRRVLGEGLGGYQWHSREGAKRNVILSFMLSPLFVRSNPDPLAIKQSLASLVFLIFRRSHEYHSRVRSANGSFER